MADVAPLFSGASPAEVAEALAPLVDFADEPLPLEVVEAMVRERLLPHLMRYDSPRFQSMFNTAPEAGALLGARLALETNQGVTNWQVSPGGAMLEELCGRALCRLFELPAEADATFMYSGTYANQQALYMALHRIAQRYGIDLARQGLQALGEHIRPVVLVSADAHFSLRHGVRMAGLGEQALVTLPVDAERRIDAIAARSIAAALPSNRPIAAIVATAGTTSTGAIDPTHALAELSEQHGAWLHVDGAYGLAYALVPDWRYRFAGLERADSITWDPHKQMGVPIPNSVLFLRQGAEFRRMALYSDYFNQEQSAAGEPNPGLKSAPSTRPLSALSLVTALRTLGLDGVRRRLRAPLDAIALVADLIQDFDDVERVHSPDTGILCFRIVPPAWPLSALNDLQRKLYAAVLQRGERTVSLTALDGVAVLRLVAVDPATGADDLLETIERLRDMVAEYSPSA